MQVNALAAASRQQVEEDLLTLIRSRSPASGPATVAANPAPAANAGPSMPDAAQTHDAVGRINDSLRSLATNLHFEVDPRSAEVVVRVIDSDTGEVLRQIPSEATLQIARSLERTTGHLVNHSI